VHLRLASSSAGRGGVRAGSLCCILLGIACGVPAAACSRQPRVADDVTVEWKLTPTPPRVDEATRAEITLRDRRRNPVRGATLKVEGHMTHPGMAPVMAPAAERSDGVYQVQLRFTMRGSWILLVTGVLPDGRRVNHRIDVTARPPG
jgi:hypothetical protein